ncbi:MAG: kelch repeat-containing protein, partial [Myxococcota bacterium]
FRGDRLTAWALTGANAGESETRRTNHRALRPLADAVLLPDGTRVALTRNRELVTLSDSGEAASFGSAALPPTTSFQMSLIYDAVQPSLLVFYGRSASGESLGITRVALDGSTAEPVAFAGIEPGVRGAAPVITHNGQVYIVGGQGEGIRSRADIIALDLRTMVWREVAEMPVARSFAQLMVVENELWIIGGTDEFRHVERIDALDLDSGTLREVAVDGAWPDQSIAAGVRLGPRRFRLRRDGEDIGSTWTMWEIETSDRAAFRVVNTCLRWPGGQGILRSPTEAWLSVSNSLYIISDAP